MSQSDKSHPLNHSEAYELACLKREESNLARCYLALLERLPQGFDLSAPSPQKGRT